MRRIIATLTAAFLVSIALPAYATDTVPVSTNEITLSFAPVVKRVMPAVVNIYTKHTEKVQTVSPFMNDPLFNQFFGMQGGGGGIRERVVHSLGSGVIIGPDGTIVTSYHVVKGSDQITVVLSDKRELEGHVQKIDERSDLAVLKVDTKGEKLPTLELRDSDTLEVGDLVLAVGNPFGVGQTVTSGIISALSRSAADVSDYQFFIQTDAAINPGNSGGALVDMRGRLIGINTAIYSHTGGYQGIGFAIPANMVRAVLSEKTGKDGDVIRPWFGIVVEPVTHEIADAEGLDIPRGVLVKEVAPHSPAEIAGIVPGDILTAIGTSEIDDPQSLNFHIATTGIGTQVEVHLWRKGQDVVVPVTFIVPPPEAEIKTVALAGNHPLNGAVVAPLTDEIAAKMGLHSTEQRVVVVKGNGGMLGVSVQAGDVIIAINGAQIHTIAELKAILAHHMRRFEMSLVRGGVVLTMTVTS